MKPLDVKTKFYNAEVSVDHSAAVLSVRCLHHASMHIQCSELEFWMPVEAVRVRKHLHLHKRQIESGDQVFSSQRQVSLYFSWMSFMQMFIGIMFGL